MATDIPAGRRGTTWADARPASDTLVLRRIVGVAGIGSAIAFIVLGCICRLQLYGDGSMFSYAVAARDAWAFHWHNISGRLFVYLAFHAPSEALVALTRDPQAGIALYGLLFFSAPLLGLAATWLLDRSKHRVFFWFACAAAACCCPLVFGFPTEMWIAQSLFWPTLAVCHDARGRAGTVLVFVLMLALVFTHEAAIVLAGVIVLTLVPRGTRDAAFLRAAGALAAALAIWTAVKLLLPPDDYDGPVMERAALHFFDPSLLDCYLLALLAMALVAYAAIFVALQRLLPGQAHWLAALTIATALAVRWLAFDHALHADERYPLRTVLFVATVALGIMAALYAYAARTQAAPPRWLPRHLLQALASATAARALSGAIVLIVLMHAVETAKFCRAWIAYTAAIRALAMGAASDPALGDARFVSSDRVGGTLNRLSWFSTTPYLSVLVAPGAAPARLVVDPSSTYFWLTCATATANEKASRAIPVESRRLIRIYACLHR